MDRAGTEPVILAWEAPSAATPDERMAALDALTARAGHSAAGVLVPFDPPLGDAAPRIAETLARRGYRVLPMIPLGRPYAQPARARSSLLASLEALSAAGALCEFDGVRYALATIEGAEFGDDSLAAVRQVLSASAGAVRIGWLRHASAHVATPPGFDYVLDWPPYGAPAGQARAPTRERGYAALILDLARRHGGDALVGPTVLWSAQSDIDLHDLGVRVTEVSPLKIAYAIDVARRFVRNRVHHGVPFWVLRAAFDPGDRAQVAALDGLAHALMRPHRPSAAVAQVSALPTGCAPGARIAVVVHLYYPELWDEIARAIEMLPEPFDLFVSCPHRLASALRNMVRRLFPQAVVYGVQNLGRDVLPFLLWLRAVGPEAYAYVLKLHGKKSTHIVDRTSGPFAGGDAWRRSALAGLVGPAGHAAGILRALDAAPEVGIVAAAGQLYDQVEWRCGTSDLVATALSRLRMDAAVAGTFPAGTMFWARGAALAPFATVADDMLDFEREAGQVDGTLHHAYERLFALVAERLGYRVTDSAALLA